MENSYCGNAGKFWRKRNAIILLSYEFFPVPLIFITIVKNPFKFHERSGKL